MTNAKYRNEWIEAEKSGSDFGTSFKLAAVDGVNAVFVLDMDDKPIGAVHTTPERNEILARFILGDGEKGMSTGTVAAMVEEMLSKMYDQMKARTLTAIEAATGQTGIGDKPLGRQIGYALDDAKRVALDVLEKRAPEITPEMLTEAEASRKRAEAEATVFNLSAACDRMEAQLWELKGQLERRRRELGAENLLGIAKSMGPAAVEKATADLIAWRNSKTITNSSISAGPIATKALGELHAGFAEGKHQG